MILITGHNSKKLFAAAVAFVEQQTDRLERMDERLRSLEAELDDLSTQMGLVRDTLIK